VNNCLNKKKNDKKTQCNSVCSRITYSVIKQRDTITRGGGEEEIERFGDSS